jgi:hypothetical protein
MSFYRQLEDEVTPWLRQPPSSRLNVTEKKEVKGNGAIQEEK